MSSVQRVSQNVRQKVKQKAPKSFFFRLIYRIFGGDNIAKRSHRQTQFTLILVFGGLLLAFLYSPVKIKIALPTLPPLIIEEEFIKVDPPKKKKYEIIFASNTEFIYHVIKPKPPRRIEFKTPPPPPPPPPKPKPEPKPKPKPQPPKPPKPQPPQTIESVAAPNTNQSAFSSSEDTGASGDQVLAELVRLVEQNKNYPKQAQRRGIQGRNFLQVIINKSGKITKASLVQGSGAEILDKASKELAQKLVGISLSVPKNEMSVKIPIVYSFR